MNKKQILIVFCMFVVFVSAMSIAFAADEIANSTVSVPVDETPIVQSTYAHEDILEADSGSFTQLDDKIQNTPVNGFIKLENNYTYSSGERVGTNGIVINKDITIDGDGHTIDGANMASIFQITDNANVVLKNIVFCNARGTNGSAISLSSNEHVDIINSQFINNSAVNGGAIYIASADTSSLVFSSTIVSSTFINNRAGNGGAIYVGGTFTDISSSTFKYNRAIDDGGSIYLDSGAHIEGNIFEHETAGIDGGAIYFNGNVDSSSIDSGIIGELGLFNNTLSFCSAGNNGGAVYFDNGGNVTNCNFAGNNATGDGGAVYFWDQGTVSNCNFTDNKAGKDGGAINMGSGTVTNCNFINNKAIRGEGGAVSFEGNGNVINCNFTGNNATTGSAIYFYSTSATKTVSNSRFLNNRANSESLEVTKNENNITITFTGNDNLLNAIYSRNNVEVTFTNVTYWGAKGINNTGSSPIALSGSNREAGQNITVGVVVNDVLVLNEVKVTDENGMIVLDISAGDNYYITTRHESDSYYTETEKTNSTMKFNVNVTSQTTNNKIVNITAKSNIFSECMSGKLLFILPNGTEINANYAGNGIWWAVHTFDIYGIWVSASYIGLDNVTVNNGTITICKGNSTITLDDVVLNYGDSIKVNVKTEGSLGITAMIDGEDVGVVKYSIPISVLNAGIHTLTVTTIPDTYYVAVTKTVNITVNKVDSTLTVDNIVFDYNSTGSATVSYDGASGVNASVIDQPNAKVNVNGNTITVSNLNAGNYTLTVTTIADANHNNITKTAKITVNKLKTELKASAISTTYNINRDLTITLKDSNGNPVAGVYVSVDLNGAKIYVTDKNGRIKLNVAKLVPKTYTAKITFKGNGNYLASSKEIKVTVKKATPKLTAKSKKFKRSVKVKKYTIVLKSNVGKAISKAKVTLKIKGKKAITVKTNAKGKAVFKIKKLTKKGKYTATVTYKGDKCYNKVTKKVKITVK